MKEARVVTTRSGLQYVDKRIGGGAPVQPGQLLILDYRCDKAACTAPSRSSDSKQFEMHMQMLLTISALLHHTAL